MYKLIEMDERFLLAGTWFFALIGIFTLNGFALFLSILASITVIIRNRNEVINMLVGWMQKAKTWLKTKKK
jgi:hypothetical protein